LTLSDSVVAIVGMGLMGGSLGKALVRARTSKEIRGLVRRTEAARDALQHKAADVAGTDPAKVLRGADLVVISTPVRTIERQISSLHEFADTGAVLTDMGSVKGNIMTAMESLPPRIRPVGGHPMCGKEISGLEASDPELFQDKVWVIVPLQRSDPNAIRLVEEMIESVGARKVSMSAEVHDNAASCVSHLPYMIAATLVSVADQQAKDCPEVWQLASSGFRDTSRVAAGNISMMMDILFANRENVMQMLGSAGRQIDEFRRLLENGDEEGLERMLSRIRMIRNTYQNLGSL
jgi:prephenate dehydrogenase